MSHTPGPWIAEGTMVVARDCYGPFIADCDQFNKTQDPKRRVTAEETRANTALIAAAPDLLSALEGLLSNIADDDDGDGTNSQSILLYEIRNAKAAVAKAKGET